MIHTIAEQLTDHFIKKASISEEDRENYNYCFEALIFDLISFLTILVLAIAVHKLIETGLYLLTFLMLRFNTGGYHAKTHLRCYLTLCFSYIAFVLLLILTPAEFFEIICFATAVVSLVVIYALAPADHENKKFTLEERRRFKLKSRVIAVLIAIVLVVGILLLPEHMKVLFIASAYGLLTIALSLVAAKINILNKE